MSASMTEVIAAHPGYQWVDKDGACSGSKVVCNGPDCSWEMDCDGHNGTTRRALHPQHVEAELAAAGYGDVRAVRAGVQKLAAALMGADLVESLDVLDTLAKGDMGPLGLIDGNARENVGAAGQEDSVEPRTR